LGESDVAVEPEDGALEIRRELGCDPGQSDVQGLEECAKRSTHLVLIDVAVCLEPRLVVVARETPKEVEGGGTKSLEIRVGDGHGVQLAMRWAVAPASHQQCRDVRERS